MAYSDPAPLPSSPASVAAASEAAAHPPSSRLKKEEDLQPVAAKVEELSESQSELLTRLQGLKQDLQYWRTKLDTRVNTYKDELSELRNTLNTNIDHLRSDFQNLKTTLQKQQEEVSASLRNLVLNDASETHATSECNGKDGIEKAPVSSLDSTKEIQMISSLDLLRRKMMLYGEDISTCNR